MFHHAGIKIPYFAFFAHDSGKRVTEAPLNMRVAMGFGATLCIAIGVLPNLFYRLLPYEMDYVPYTSYHVINQVQLLLLASLAFTFLIRTGLYPPETRSVNVDADWLYRRGLPAMWRSGSRAFASTARVLAPPRRRALDRAQDAAARWFAPNGPVAFPWPTHVMVWWVLLVFWVVLFVALL